MSAYVPNLGKGRECFVEAAVHNRIFVQMGAKCQYNTARKHTMINSPEEENILHLLPRKSVSHSLLWVSASAWAFPRPLEGAEYGTGPICLWNNCQFSDTFVENSKMHTCSRRGEPSARSPGVRQKLSQHQQSRCRLIKGNNRAQ